ncbi:MAG: hypothetical protein LBF22_07945 [Deltaproteobacteria bacterium]|jgi:hypothetical protein|nr:hypothetical protein [Deltaproteobacteria bacterium]
MKWAFDVYEEEVFDVYEKEAYDVYEKEAYDVYEKKLIESHIFWNNVSLLSMDF